MGLVKNWPHPTKKIIMKKLSKKIEDTQKEMQEARVEDSIRLRKKAEELIASANEDVKLLLKSKEDLTNNLLDVNTRLIKTNGALSILKILLDDKSNG